MGKLLAIDGLHIVRRVYEASAEPDSPEKADLALRHSLASIHRLLNFHAPSHALAAFDAEGPSWRHELYSPYRQQRKPMPAALQERLPNFFHMLAEEGVSAVAVPAAEMEDVVATVALRWMKDQRGEAIVASNNKDLLVLLAHGVQIWDHFSQEWRSAAWVEQKFGVKPAQIPDLIALMGDAGNQIPGVPKVGIKAAARLLNSYGDLEGVLAGAGILMDALGERLRKERDNLPLYRRLATPRSDLTLGLTWNKLAYRPPAAF